MCLNLLPQILQPNRGSIPHSIRLCKFNDSFHLYVFPQLLHRWLERNTKIGKPEIIKRYTLISIMKQLLIIRQTYVHAFHIFMKKISFQFHVKCVMEQYLLLSNSKNVYIDFYMYTCVHTYICMCVCIL